MQPNAKNQASKKDCKACQSLLFSYAMDEASAQEKAWADSHLKTCSACQQEYQKVKAIAWALQTDEVPELPADFSYTLHQKLIAAANEKKKSAFSDVVEKLKNAGVFRVGVPALACICLVVGVFSSGLFDRWMNPALEAETVPPVVSVAPVTEEDATIEPETEQGAAPVQTAQNIIRAEEKDTPIPAAEKQETEETAAKPVAEDAEDPVTDAAAPMMASEAEDVPMMAAYSEDDATAEAAQEEAAMMEGRAQPDAIVPETSAAGGASGGSSAAYALRETAVSYLHSVQGQLPFSWESRAVEVTENRVVLELSYEEWEAFSSVASGILLEKNEDTKRVTVAVER